MLGTLEKVVPAYSADAGSKLHPYPQQGWGRCDPLIGRPTVPLCMGLPVLKLEESWANQDTWSPCVIVRTVKGCFLRHLMVTRCCVEGRAASQTDSLMRCLLFTPWEIEDPKFYRILEKTTEWSFLLPPLFCDVTWREIEWPAQGHAASWDGAGTGGLHALVPPCLSHPADPSASARPHPYLS